MKIIKNECRSLLLLSSLLIVPIQLNAEINAEVMAKVHNFKNKKIILDEQQSVINHALNNIDIGKLDETEVYYVGFAGSSAQRVFYNDIQLAKNSLEKRYKLSQHSILLANQSTTLDKVPLATTSNLAFVLKGLATKMNKDEDILFLFLSSHGGKEAYFTTSFFQFENTGIYANEIREILDQTQIRNRVILLSGCYSGSFIPALQNDNTLIITAARKDRTSFGCSNEYEYTFFTEAYFREAISKNRTLTKAFEMAEKIVHQREKAQQIKTNEYSLPQIYIGRTIEKTLSLAQSK